MSLFRSLLGVKRTLLQPTALFITFAPSGAQGVLFLGCCLIDLNH
jgi:hypothetical protein